MTPSTEKPTYQVNQPSSMLALAGELTNFIKCQNLSKVIHGKEYVFCEGGPMQDQLWEYYRL